MNPVERPRTRNFPRKKISARIAGGILSSAIVASLPAANAQTEFKLGDDSAVTVGFGVRSSYTSTERGAPNGTSRSNDFAVDQARLFMSGHYGKVIKGTFNVEGTASTAQNGGDSFRLLDAIVQFEFAPAFNIWMGRFLPPQDRANGYGPFFALPWSYPGTVSGYPQIENGRDNGAMVWGKPFGGKLTYSFGAFEGHNKLAGYSAVSDKLAFSGRLVAHLWDPEPAPAHLAGGWFGGSKDLLSIGLGGYTQKDGVGSAATPGKLSIWNVDMLLEKKLGFGVPTLELGYYKYKLGIADCNSGEPGAPICPVAPANSNSGGMADGKAFLVGGGFLFPQKIGWGQFQPYFRYQKFDRTLSNTVVKTTDYGLNYIIKGPNAKISAQYTKMEDSRLPVGFQDRDQFTLGVQLQY